MTLGAVVAVNLLGSHVASLTDWHFAVFSLSTQHNMNETPHLNVNLQNHTHRQTCTVRNIRTHTANTLHTFNTIQAETDRCVSVCRARYAHTAALCVHTVCVLFLSRAQHFQFAIRCAVHTAVAVAVAAVLALFRCSVVSLSFFFSVRKVVMVCTQRFHLRFYIFVRRTLFQFHTLHIYFVCQKVSIRTKLTCVKINKIQ